MMFLAHAAAAIERVNLDLAEVASTIHVAEHAALNALRNLAIESFERGSLFDPRMIADKAVVRARTTMVVGCAALLYLWLSSIGERDSETCEHAAAVVRRHFSKIEIWGESAVPFVVCQYEAMRRIYADCLPDEFLAHIIELLTIASSPKAGRTFPDPYVDASDAILSTIEPPKNADQPRYSGLSWTLEALWHLYVRLNWRGRAAVLWPELSSIALERFVPEQPWQAYLWRTDRGTCQTMLRPRRQSWKSLRAESAESSGASVPQLFRQNPCLYLAFLVTYPHRLNADGIRWVDTALAHAIS
jgi:hypothetical protein